MDKMITEGAQEISHLPGGGVVLISLLAVLLGYFIFHAIIEPRQEKKSMQKSWGEEMKDIKERLSSIERSLTQIIMPDNREHGVADRLSKIEVGIHDLRGLLQQEILKASMLEKDITDLRADNKDHEKRLNFLESKLQAMEGKS